MEIFPAQRKFSTATQIYRMWFLQEAEQTRLDARRDKPCTVLPSRILLFLTLPENNKGTIPPPPKKGGGLDSSVGIATNYRLDGQGIEPRWGARFSAPVQTGPGAQPASCTMGTGFFPGGKRPGRVELTTHPPI